MDFREQMKTYFRGFNDEFDMSEQETSLEYSLGISFIFKKNGTREFKAITFQLVFWEFVIFL